MDASILNRLSGITEEEKEILKGRRSIDRSLYMDGSRDVISGEKLLERGKLIAIRPHTRFLSFPEHSHDYVEMVYMCAGETRHVVNGSPITLRQGELLMLGQNARQSIEPAGEKDIAVNIIVRPAFFSGTLPFLGEEETPLRRFVVSCLTGKNEAGYLLFHVAEILPIQNLIENLLYTIMEDTPNRRAILQMTMGLLFAQLMNHTENYTELLQEKRLSQAAWLLRNTGKRVDEIANAVGYENLSYFHRLFAARFGQSPKKYRDCK